MPQTPRSYDEITRGTVPQPDSSFRPTKLQEQQANEGFRMLDADEHALHDRVQAAIGSEGIDFEIERTRVILRGHVATGARFQELEDRVRAITGVQQVENDLVIRG